MDSFSQLDTRRITIFLAIAYGIAWATALAIYFLGGLPVNTTSLSQAPDNNALLVIGLTASVYMMAPAAAHFLTRLITREGFHDIAFRPNLKKTWRYWLAAWFAPTGMAIVGIVIYFLLFPSHFDGSMSAINTLAPTGAPTPPWLLTTLLILQATAIAPLLNSLFTFGEEFGWRGYLLHKLMPLGGRKAVLVLGVIWGIWHWPLTAMGHNYGLSYTGAPWIGMLTMVWFTSVLGIFLAWVTLRSGSFWPAVIGHAAVNGIAGLGSMFLKGTPHLLLGPTSAGWIGSVGFAIIAALIFFTPGQLDPYKEKLDSIPRTKEAR